ncbi:MAG: hypothetical protein H0V44_00270 [Planctomycetes bacterium]|nr:hypothetical protein [Planctomycetota bacterium]
MNKAKPFLFWIIAGAIILVELVLLIFISPTGESGNSPQDVKGNLDRQSQKLSVLHAKALGPKGQPTPALRVFDAEDPADIKDLTSLWLPTPQWKKPLEDHVALYNQQLPAISSYLTGRSVFLHQPIADTSDKFSWYETYARLTGQVLQALHEKAALAMPSAGSGGSNIVDFTALDFTSADAVRRIAGFYTKGTSLPDPSEYPALTLRYHVVELIALALLENPATNKETPIAPVKTQHEERAALAGVEWKSQSDTAISLVLTLHGPISALLAAEAALEQIHDGTKPIIVVTGGSLARKTYNTGERTGSAEDLVAKLSLEVLDFNPGEGERTASRDIAQPIVPFTPSAAAAVPASPAQAPSTTPPVPGGIRPGPGQQGGPGAPVGPGPGGPPGPGNAGGPPRNEAMPPGQQAAPGGPQQ